MIVLWYIFPICKIGYSPTHMPTDIYCKPTSCFYSLWTRHIYYNIQYNPGTDSLAGCWDKYLCAEQILLIDLSTASSSLSQLCLPPYSQWAFIRNVAYCKSRWGLCRENEVLGKKRGSEKRSMYLCVPIGSKHLKQREGGDPVEDWVSLSLQTSTGISKDEMLQEGFLLSQAQTLELSEVSSCGGPGFPKAFSKCCFYWIPSMQQILLRLLRILYSSVEKQACPFV